MFKIITYYKYKKPNVQNTKQIMYVSIYMFNIFCFTVKQNNYCSL